MIINKKSVFLGLAFLVAPFFVVSSASYAQTLPVDNHLHTKVHRVLKPKNQLDTQVSKTVNAKKIVIELPTVKEQLELKEVWPARKETDCTKQKCVALTFDDGPSIYTPELLDILKSKNAKATFFIVGSRVAGQEQTIQRIVNEGHEVGNHSFSHTDFRRIDQAQIDAEVLQTQNEIFRASGVRPHVLRPPYGALPLQPQGQLKTLPTILWNTDPNDWEKHLHEHIADHVSSGVTPGSIVLLHDLYPTTINSVPKMIDTLTAQGYVFVTVTELFGWEQGQQLPNGQVLKSR